MEATPYAAGEGRLYFSKAKIDSTLASRTRVLSEAGSVTEAAANFFDCLHELDSMGFDFIRAEEAPDRGLGEAINDRLRHAASD
jgi:L-threonylcarbamoyladenylate synthase